MFFSRCTLFLWCTSLWAASCYGLRSSEGGAQVKQPEGRNIQPQDIAIPEGYRISLVARGLTFPTGITFDAQGRPCVVEAGYSYGEVFLQPRLLRIDGDTSFTTIYQGDKNGPWNGVFFHDGFFYVSEGGVVNGGKILKISPEGTARVLVDSLPSFGDHHTNGPVVRDNYVYFGQGTATNSGVVGPDNAEYGWLKRHTDFHDIPCADITLTGQNFTSDQALPWHDSAVMVTGAYVAYGIKTHPGQVIRGQLPCSGAVLRVPVTGGAMELVAWGFRNPYGLAFSPEGQLYLTENAYDDRGSRPVWGTGDVLWRVEQGKWYGWPDFAEGRPLDSEMGFKPPGGNNLKPLLATRPGEPPHPVAVLGVHSSSNSLDFSSAAFGYPGEAFIAQFGDLAPQVGKVLGPVGFKVIRVNTETGAIYDFAVNRGDTNGPASFLGKGGLERPIAVRFNPEGNALYVVDFGIMTMTPQGARPVEGSGVVWRITRNRE